MRRDIFTAIGLSTWVASVLTIGVAMTKAAAAGRQAASALATTGSGLLGASADPDGVEAMARGVAGQFLIMLMAATLFVLAARRFPVLVARPWASGILYGLAVHLALPGEALGSSGAILLTVAIDVLTIGLPIALITTKVMRPDAALVPRAPDPRNPAP